MKVTVNGNEKKLKEGATLGDAMNGEIYVEDTLISVRSSSERIRTETDDLELMTTKGPMTIHLDDSADARIWRSMTERIQGTGARWATKNIVAFGSFPTEIKVNREARMYRRYDCFFSLGGFDSNTTYMMVALDDHRWAYGAGTGRIGRITSGRHVLELLREGDRIVSVMPTVSEKSSENTIVTKDKGRKMEEGMIVETHVMAALNEASPMSCEHLLVTAQKGYISVSDSCGSYVACSDSTDVSLDSEKNSVRERGCVTVRAAGDGTGRIFFYKDRRQLLPSHNDAGRVVRGMGIIASAKPGDRITLVTDLKRMLSVGMTQSEGEKFLASLGIRQIRTGDTSDDAVIAEQEPEWTLHVSKSKEAETFGVPAHRVFGVSFNRKNEPESVHYLEKVTGLSHKPIGTMKVHFTFKGLPLVTFEGDRERGRALYPGTEFKKCKKGDIGVTNQARPDAGLIGIRLEDSKEFGPTGEQPYGTNIAGTFKGNIKELMDGLKEGSIIYIREEGQ